MDFPPTPGFYGLVTYWCCLSPSSQQDPGPRLTVDPSKGQSTRAEGQQDMDTQWTHEPTRFLFLGVVFTCECATVQGILIGMKVFLVQWITVQQDTKIFKTKQPPARCPMCARLPLTTSDPFYTEMATATAQTWRKNCPCSGKILRNLDCWGLLYSMLFTGILFFPLNSLFAFYIYLYYYFKRTGAGEETDR